MKKSRMQTQKQGNCLELKINEEKIISSMEKNAEVLFLCVNKSKEQIYWDMAIQSWRRILKWPQEDMFDANKPIQVSIWYKKCGIYRWYF